MGELEVTNTADNSLSSQSDSGETLRRYSSTLRRTCVLF
jgi:hypothetical protein